MQINLTACTVQCITLLYYCVHRCLISSWRKRTWTCWEHCTTGDTLLGIQQTFHDNMLLMKKLYDNLDTISSRTKRGENFNMQIEVFCVSYFAQA